MTIQEVGLRIKERREELDMSMQELADAVGVNKATIFRYETGQFKMIKLPVIESIANALRVNPSWLVGKSNDKFGTSTATNKDIELIIKNTTDLLNQEGLMLNGSALSHESIQSIIDAMQIGLELAKKRIKETE